MKTALLTKLVLAWATACLLVQPGQATEAPGPALQAGQLQCESGHYTLALGTLNEVYRQEPRGPQQVQAAGALGLAYMRMRQPLLAQRYLREAFNAAGSPLERARYALDLANLAASQRDTLQAQQLYAAVLQLAPADAALQVSVALNTVPLAPAAQRLGLLEQILPQVDALPEPKDRAAFLLSLGFQAQAARADPRARPLAHQAFSAALSAARQLGDARLMASAQSQLAQLYEDAQRTDDALLLTTQGIVNAQAPPARDLLIELEWRRGRLLVVQGQLAAAIGAYQRAVDQIDAVRQDIPVEYENGRSSFRDTLEPVYLGLADLLLRQAGQLDAAQQGRQFRRVRDTLERIKQTELEDFLGNRCALQGAGPSPQSATVETPVARGTAVLYPVILPDRLELLIETTAGIERRTVAITATALRRDVLAFAAALRARQPYLELSRRLHKVLLSPATALLQQQAVQTLVVVPDSVLRLVPFGALHDGQRFAIEAHAIAVVPAVTLAQGAAKQADARPVKLLLAGVSEPGGVVEKLPDYMTAQLLADAGPGPAAPIVGARSMFTRGMKKVDILAAPPPRPQVAPTALANMPAAERAARYRSLQAKLALSGVAEEVVALARLAPSTTLLNQGFSVQTFSEQVKSGNYRVVHIASHGVFGATADATFIMAHDDVITIDQMQAFLRGRGLRDRPIELLTLSACETAEGDDRAPLGLSGAALKAQAQSALGSLWPVSDDAAKVLMGDFYRNLVQTGLRDKARALQDAQLRMIRQAGLQHPYFWAPFILVERRL